MVPSTQSCLVLLSCLLSAISGLSHTLFHEKDAPQLAASTAAHIPSLSPRSLPAGLELRVLPIGDSITVGVGSSDGNGYRLDLINMIKGGGQVVNLIGTQQSGQNNPDNYNEGYGGNRISQILDHLQGNNILRQQPNLVLIHAGTNDNDLEITGETYADGPNRLATLIDYVLCHDPDAVVLVAQLIGNKYNQTQTDRFNYNVPDVVGDRYTKGYKIRTVDMTPIRGDLLSDLLHPNDQGYNAMAYIWYSAITDLPKDWWTTLSPASAGSVETCARGSTFFTPALEGNYVATGAHVSTDPGEGPAAPGNTFQPGWGDDGVIAIGVGRAGSGVHFADIDGDGRSDYLWVDPKDSSVRAWLNKDKTAWAPVNGGNQIAFGTGNPAYVEFADLTGDKRAEYILVVDGHFRVYRNDGPNGEVWLWSPFDQAGQQIDSLFEGAAGYHYFGDMNGDGLADLVVVNSNGVLDFYIQQGQIGTDGFSWRSCKNKGLFSPQMILVDIDGDGRADYLSMDPDGGIHGWLNKPGGECDITWVPINGGGAKTVALGAAPAAKIRMADLNGDGKADYMVIDDDTGGVHFYPNVGSTHRPDPTDLAGYGAAVRLHDLDGDGRDDYISVSDQTAVLAYLNAGQSENGWVWRPQADGNVIAFGFAGAKRHQIHFADVNADGRDDFLVVDDTTAAVHCYLNNGPAAGQAWSWKVEQDAIAIGVGKPGAGVRFADVTGDGRADYIYVEDGGAARIWINRGPYNQLTNWAVMNDGNVAALGVGANPRDVQFADIDGDGLADYLWIHPDTGAVEVWYNNGPSGNALGWIYGGQIATGIGAPGKNVRFARIGGSGRADYVVIDESTGALKVWLNGCSQVIGRSGSHVSSEICGSPPRPSQPAPETPPGPRPLNCDPDNNPDPECVLPMKSPDCDKAQDYHSLDDVINDPGVHVACMNLYLMNALAETMIGAIANYSNIMNAGYKEKYGYFVSLVRNTAVESWEKLRSHDRDTYWDCYETRRSDGQNSSVSCNQLPSGTAFYYVLKDPDHFCQNINDKYNLDCAWLHNVTQKYKDASDSSIGCTKFGNCKTGDRTYPDIDREFGVPDPSDIITSALRNLTDFSNLLSDTRYRTQLGWFGESIADAVEGGATLVLTTQGATQAMQTVYDTGAKEEEEAKKRQIIAFITAFLLLIPIGGEVAEGINSLQWVVRMARLADFTGNTALSIYGIVEDHNSAPEAIAGILLGGAALKSDIAWVRAAAKGRGIQQDVLKSMGDNVVNGVTKIRRKTNKCLE